MRGLITEDWRLKLLAFGLAVLMLGAVAFSQNPTTRRTLVVSINYLLPDKLVLINPPTKTQVGVTGLADTVQSLSDRSVVATFDLANATPGPSVQVNLKVKSLVSGVTIQNPTVPYALNIDRKDTIPLVVSVRTPRVAAGWEVTNRVALCPESPCKVNFTGPSSWETNLTAVADFPIPVDNDKNNVLSVGILLLQNGTPLDLSRLTYPAAGLDVPTTNLHIEARTGSSSRQVVLIDAPPSHGPAPGYRITNVSIDPVTVLITGPPDALTSITTITLPSVDLSGATSDRTFQIAIPYPRRIDGSVQLATVTYSISANPAASPSP
jgi:YbbR domain-containing protein